MKVKDKISNHFLGITDEYLNAHNKLVKKVQARTRMMLKYEIKKNKRLLNEESI